MSNASAKLLAAAVLTAMLALAASHAVELDPKAVVYQLPDQIKWGPVTPAGNQQAVLFGDPTNPGLYGVLTKWVAGNHFSKPHFHPNDRFITVISGTWWVGSGPNFDPANGSVPMPAGSFVTHYGKQVHWDGAKDVDAVLLIVGNGPATATPFVSADQLK
ncbi:MAG: cupin domain-containing protein [Pseudolabrys sp.]